MPAASQQLEVCCELESGCAEASDSDEESNGFGDDNDILCDSEQLTDDLCLVQEIEMDREAWLRLLACMVKLLPNDLVTHRHL